MASVWIVGALDGGIYEVLHISRNGSVNDVLAVLYFYDIGPIIPIYREASTVERNINTYSYSW